MFVHRWYFCVSGMHCTVKQKHTEVANGAVLSLFCGIRMRGGMILASPSQPQPAGLSRGSRAALGGAMMMAMMNKKTVELHKQMLELHNYLLQWSAAPLSAQS